MPTASEQRESPRKHRRLRTSTPAFPSLLLSLLRRIFLPRAGRRGYPAPPPPSNAFREDKRWDFFAVLAFPSSSTFIKFIEVVSGAGERLPSAWSPSVLRSVATAVASFGAPWFPHGGSKWGGRACVAASIATDVSTVRACGKVCVWFSSYFQRSGPESKVLFQFACDLGCDYW
jgi:hypothetical protein